MLARKKGFVSVWFGADVAKKTLNEYAIKETYSEDDSIPINDFAKDTGSAFYDHDFLTCVTKRGKNKPIREFLDDIEGQEFFVEELEASAKSKKIPEGNCLVLLRDEELKPKRWPKGSPLTFLGTFPYEPEGVEIKPPKLRKHDHKKFVCTAEVSSDGQLAVTVSSDGSFHLWDLETGSFIAKKPTDGELLGWLSNSEFITDEDGHFVLWEYGSKGLRKKRTLKTSISPLRPVLLPDIRAIAWVHRKLVVGYVDDWNPEEIPHPKDRKYNTWFIDPLLGGKCVSLNFKSEQILWDVESKKPLYKAKLKQSAVSADALDEDRFLLDCDIHSCADGKKLGSLEERDARSNTVLLSGRMKGCIARSGSSVVDCELVVWNEKGKIQSEFEFEETSVSVSFAAKANLAFTASYDGNVNAFSLSNMKKLATWRCAPLGRKVEFDPQDNDGYELYSVGATPDGKRIVVGEKSGRVHILSFDRKNKFQVIR